MKENVTVNVGVAHYYPDFQNPIFLAAKKQELRNELLGRIKIGCFENLHPLIKSLRLTTSEVDDILSFWRENNKELIYIYYNALMSGDLNQVNLADSIYHIYKFQIELEENRRKK